MKSVLFSLAIFLAKTAYGQDFPHPSCNTPTGGLPDEETPVDCVGAGLIALAPTNQSDCEGGRCGLEECCAPAHCHSLPPGYSDIHDGWSCRQLFLRASHRSNDSRFGYGYSFCSDYADTIRFDAIDHLGSAYWDSPHCCECGGGSTEPYMSCKTPAGRRWDETPVDASRSCRWTELLSAPGRSAGSTTAAARPTGRRPAPAPI